MAEMAFHLGRDIVCAANGQEVNDFHVLDEWGARDEGLDQLLGFRASRMNVHAHIGLNALNGFTGGNGLATIFG